MPTKLSMLYRWFAILYTSHVIFSMSILPITSKLFWTTLLFYFVTPAVNFYFDILIIGTPPSHLSQLVLKRYWECFIYFPAHNTSFSISYSTPPSYSCTKPYHPSPSLLEEIDQELSFQFRRDKVQNHILILLCICKDSCW